VVPQKFRYGAKSGAWLRKSCTLMVWLSLLEKERERKKAGRVALLWTASQKIENAKGSVVAKEVGAGRRRLSSLEGRWTVGGKVPRLEKSRGRSVGRKCPRGESVRGRGELKLKIGMDAFARKVPARILVFGRCANGPEHILLEKKKKKGERREMNVGVWWLSDMIRAEPRMQAPE